MDDRGFNCECVTWSRRSTIWIIIYLDNYQTTTNSAIIVSVIYPFRKKKNILVFTRSTTCKWQHVCTIKKQIAINISFGSFLLCQNIRFMHHIISIPFMTPLSSWCVVLNNTGDCVDLNSRPHFSLVIRPCPYCYSFW